MKNSSSLQIKMLGCVDELLNNNSLVQYCIKGLTSNKFL